MAKVLIVDDDKGMCYTLSSMVRQKGHNVICAYTLQQGLEQASMEEFDVVFLDVQLPDGNGLEQLPNIMETPSNPEVIIITAQGDPNGAELAIRSGAWDYIEKPSSIKEMTLPFIRALQYRGEKKTEKSFVFLKREGIIGNSFQMRKCLGQLAQAAISEVSVLITGETGTGKELFAKAIHENSSRFNNNYVVVDCAALPETLVESTLFGHVKGAFTGADKDSGGLIKHADGGTLLLDEVGEMPISIQKAFLRVLQEKRFRSVGSKQEMKSDFRLTASTNRNLDQMVQEGLFRSDLLFRLKTFTINLPTLKDRREDIKDLAIHYVSKLCDLRGLGTKEFSPEFLSSITEYSWPGNVRELINAIERSLVVSATEPTLFPKHLPTYIRISIAKGQKYKGTQVEGFEKEKVVSPLTFKTFPNFRDYRNKYNTELEAQYLKDLMLHTRFNTKIARKISGLSNSRFYALLKKYNISLSGPL